MTQTAETDVAPGLRERKKRATRRALQRAALELVAEHGLEAVTVEQVAAAADVSPRTFFNYFATKEDALATGDPDAVGEITAALAARPDGEHPWAALREVSLERARRMGDDTEFWRLRWGVVQRYPEIGARLVGASVASDREVTRTLAARLGVDPLADPRPAVLAGAASVAKRTAVALWLAQEQRRSLADVLAECFDALGHLEDA